MSDTPNVLLRTVAVPGWIYRALIRSKFSGADLNEYARIRQVLSPDDLAQWFYTNNHLKVNNDWTTGSLQYDHFQGLTREETSEIQNSVVPLSNSEEIASSVKTRLAAKQAGWEVQCSHERDYEFVLVDNTIYVILYEGFLNSCQDPKYSLEFLQNYLEKCYSMTSIADVSRMAVFRTYINHLAN